MFATIPELLCVLLNVESLEDNEVLTIENVRRLGRVLDPKKKATFTSLENSLKVSNLKISYLTSCLIKLFL